MQGKYPKFLPPPIIKEPESEYFMVPPYVDHELEGYTPPTEFEKNGFIPPSDTVYKQNTEYFWLNPGRDVKLPYLTLRTSRGEGLVYDIRNLNAPEHRPTRNLNPSRTVKEFYHGNRQTYDT